MPEPIALVTLAELDKMPRTPGICAYCARDTMVYALIEFTCRKCVLDGMEAHGEKEAPVPPAAQKPTIASVTAVLIRNGWSAYRTPGFDGFKVGMEGGVIRVEYEAGHLPVSRDGVLAAMAHRLRREGWFVTDAGRLLVSES